MFGRPDEGPSVPQGKVRWADMRSGLYGEGGIEQRNLYKE